MSAHLGLAVTAFVDGELSHARREQVLAHLAHCPDCRAEVDEVRRFKCAVRQCDTPEVPFDLTARLLAVTVTVVSEELPRRHLARRLVRRRPGRSTTVGVLVVIGLGGALSLGGPGPTAPAAPVDPTSNRFVIDHAGTTGEVPFTEPDILTVGTPP